MSDERAMNEGFAEERGAAGPDESVMIPPVADEPAAPEPRRVTHDLRGLDPERFDAALLRGDASRGLMLTAWQAARAPREDLMRFSDVVVVVPDFLNYARLLNTGQARAVLGLSGSMARTLAAGVRAGLGVCTRPLKLARQDFWIIAETLLRMDLALLPSTLEGAPRLLHPNLADFAFAFDQRDFMRRVFRLAGAGGGVFTQQLPMAANCLARWGLEPAAVAFLCPPGHDDTANLVADLRGGKTFARTRLIADVSSLPDDLQDVEELAELIPGGVDDLLFAPAGPRVGAADASPATQSETDAPGAAAVTDEPAEPSDAGEGDDAPPPPDTVERP